MKNRKEKAKAQNEELAEMMSADFGLEQVEKGCDFAEGDQQAAADCGGL